jgi:Cu(I)/Ag(I) efflux system membrane protein CusA/SilA
MALPVFFGMFVELVSLFVVPVLYCGYMEMNLSLQNADRVALPSEATGV